MLLYIYIAVAAAFKSITPFIIAQSYFARAGHIVGLHENNLSMPSSSFIHSIIGGLWLVGCGRIH